MQCRQKTNKINNCNEMMRIGMNVFKPYNVIEKKKNRKTMTMVVVKRGR